MTSQAPASEAIVAGLAAVYAAKALAEEKIGQPYRSYVATKTLGKPGVLGWIGEGATCRVCLTFWLSQAVSIARGPRRLLDRLTTGLAGAGLAYIWIKLEEQLK